MPILALQQDSDEESSDGSEQRLQDDRAGMSKGATEAITAMAHPFVPFHLKKHALGILAHRVRGCLDHLPQQCI